MPPAPFKLLRIAVVGSAVFGLAAGAHLLAGGTLPVPPIMAAILALHIMVTTVATKFRLTLPIMAALLAGSQLVLHQGFESFSHGVHLSTGALGENHAAAAAMNHHAMSAEAHAAAMLAQTASLNTPGLDNLGLDSLGHAGETSGWMLAAHVAATLVTAGLLAYGENALWSLANWLRPLYRRAAVVLQIPPKSARPNVIPRPLARQPWRNLRPDTRRGPPTRTAISA